MAESGLSAATIPEQREAMAQMASSAAPPEGVAIEPVTLGGRPAEWLTPEGGSQGAVCTSTAAGYCIGSLDTHRHLGARIAQAAGSSVVVLDYRLAPEHPFPAALDDAVGGLRRPIGPGADPARLAIAGDSAGGGLTVATLLALRAREVPAPGGRGVPVAVGRPDPVGAGVRSAGRARSDGLQVRPRPDGRGLPGRDRPSHRTGLAPVRREPDGLPPLLIEVGEHEVLLDDAHPSGRTTRGCTVST